MVYVLNFSISGNCQTNPLNIRVQLPGQHTTVYDALNQISRATGYFFIYDSDLIDNDKRIRLQRIDQDLKTALNAVLNDPSLDFKVLGNHILVYRPRKVVPENETAAQEVPLSGFFIIRGRVLDQESGTPLPYATIGIPEKGLGTASNKEGGFLLKLPDSLMDCHLRVSYMGYKSRELPLMLLNNTQSDIFLETDYISMQEVIIRYYDPDAIVREALNKRLENFSNEPVYQTNFYREGVLRNNKLLNYSEALFRVYKPSYDANFDTEQVLLLKSRHIVNVEETDTLVLKIKAGVRSALDLDIIKSIPVFLDADFIGDNNFKHVDIVTRDSKPVYAIEFEQSSESFIPVYRGVLFIDKESMAIIGAEFEVHPKHIDKSSHVFVAQRNRKFNASFERINYTVTYQYFNGRYHLNHVRGDLKMRFRPRNRIFSNNYHVFLEMAVGKIDNREVSRFNRKEVLRTNVTFVDQDFEYDYDFWEEYNIIAPEKQIDEAFTQIRSKIESIVNEAP